ncbi:hypothetical protein [Hugenholtzia roseola]|uniref:fluoroquinolone export ABC transporter permease subunit n=1 Tax=Hugenholtzia roseola TaxID=1002 RepID=UPI00040EE812|nr:hypothetical protein [Hugenholtzia roseola]
MKTLLQLTLWELRLQWRERILAVVMLITALYVALFSYFDNLPTALVVLLISTDPTMLGFLFIGVIILFEKSANTIQSLLVTPIQKYHYLGAKALSLTLVALVASTIMAWAAQKNCNYFVLALAVCLSSFHFVWIGFLGVARVKTINQYFFIFPFLLTPLMLPLLNFFGLTDSLWLYVFPFQACLLLFQAAFEPLQTWQWLYALLYLPLSTALIYYAAEIFYTKYLLK